MTDMICRKSMSRCQTPSMCSPHGGCREPAFKPDWNRLEAAQESLREHMQIIAQLKAENERLKTLRSTTERDLAQELEVWRHGPSCWNCGDTGDVHDMVGEWLGQCDCNAAKLIDVSSERDQLRAEIAGLRTGYEAYERVNAELKGQVEALRKDADRLQSATAFVQKLCDSAGKQPSVATGYLHDILSALGQGEQS